MVRWHKLCLKRPDLYWISESNSTEKLIFRGFFLSLLKTKNLLRLHRACLGRRQQLVHCRCQEWPMNFAGEKKNPLWQIGPDNAVRWGGSNRLSEHPVSRRDLLTTLTLICELLMNKVPSQTTCCTLENPITDCRGTLGNTPLGNLSASAHIRGRTLSSFSSFSVHSTTFPIHLNWLFCVLCSSLIHCLSLFLFFLIYHCCFHYVWLFSSHTLSLNTTLPQFVIAWVCFGSSIYSRVRLAMC